MSEIEKAYDSQDENLQEKLESDWSQEDDEDVDPTWVPESSNKDEKCFTCDEESFRREKK